MKSMTNFFFLKWIGRSFSSISRIMLFIFNVNIYCKMQNNLINLKEKSSHNYNIIIVIIIIIIIIIAIINASLC